MCSKSSVLCPKSKFSNRFCVDRDREFWGSRLVCDPLCHEASKTACILCHPCWTTMCCMRQKCGISFQVIIKRGQENGNVLTLLFCQDYASKLKHFDSIMIAVGWELNSYLQEDKTPQMLVWQNLNMSLKLVQDLFLAPGCLEELFR